MIYSRYFVKRPTRSGFSLKELLVVIVIISAGLFLLLPSLHQGRGQARRAICQGHLKQMVLALHNFHDTYGHLPSAMGGTGVGGNEGRLSGMVELLPMIEQSALYEVIQRGDPAAGIPPGGPVPWDRSYPPWQTRQQYLQCPSAEDGAQDFQSTNYAFCIGDVAADIHQLPKLRGAFAPGLKATFDDILDGMSNTIALAEIGTVQQRDVQGQYAIDLPASILSDPAIGLQTLSVNQQTYRNDVSLHKYGRGYNWVDGAAGPGLVNTILPPNGPSCAVGGKGPVDGIYSAGSYHPGGVNVAFCDGSVHFITDDIDCGNVSAAPPTAQAYDQQSIASPFGLWGAMGTIDGEKQFTANDH
ncbi:DUF1559 domain-containing protein [Bremerella alba]|uniref:DUF1559 domain-containing protein n=1 Tax=Bremerella alba TaxID=980252 RepID=A0A7V8V489_9BACT|nr:DUF1559 domain-containing protein [Bremerella alba]MBA2114670.1 hypothetical protein [Bremerella alba]